jgi:signal transduction histidine kinase
MNRIATTTRLVATAGTALAATFPAFLAPYLAGFGPATRSWQGGIILCGAVTAAAVGLWSRGALPHRTEDAATPEACLAARTFPLRLTRGLFWVAILASIASAVALTRSLGASAALLPAVIIYLMLLLPIAGLYFVTSGLLRTLAQAPADLHVPAGGRQPIALRLTLAVQLPVLLCALGMVLVEQTAGTRYEQAIEQYGRERYGRLLDRVLGVLPPSARRTLFERLDPPEGVLIFEEARGRPAYTLAGTDGLEARPVKMQIPLLFLVLGVVALALLHGRWLPREITAELGAVRRALDVLDQGHPPPEANPHGLKETAELAAALERAVAGFEARRLALSAAAAERRDSERRKALFLGHLSHELKSPLNSILGFSELLLAGLDGPLRPRQRDQLAAVWRQGESLERFILALLDATRLGEAGRAATLLTPAAVSLEHLAAAVRDQLRPDPLDARRVEVVEQGTGTCRIDLTYTARAIRLLVGLLQDRIDAGCVRVTFAPEASAAEKGSESGGLPRLSAADASPVARSEASGVVVLLQVLEAEADPAERIALRRALRTDGPSPDTRSGAVPATRLLVQALGAAQGSQFTALTDDEAAWPKLRLFLPGQAQEA